MKIEKNNYIEIIRNANFIWLEYAKLASTGYSSTLYICDFTVQLLLW